MIKAPPRVTLTGGAIGAKIAWICGVAAVVLVGMPVAIKAQGPPPGFPAGSPPERFPGISWWESPWWNGAAAQDLNLTDVQKGDINTIVKDYRSKMMEMRSAIGKADRDVAAAFAENPVDPRKANDAIDKLAASRGDLTRALSQMSLKVRLLLTAEQWQDLQQRSFESRMRPGNGRERARRPGDRGPGVAPQSASKQ